MLISWSRCSDGSMWLPFWSVVREIFYDRGGARPKAPDVCNAKYGSSPKLDCFMLKQQTFSKKKVFYGNGVSLSPKNQRSLKKKVFTGNGVSFSPKNQRSPKKIKVFTGNGVSF